MTSPQDRAEEAFAAKDLDALAGIAEEVQQGGLADPGTSRVFSLLGELYRKNGRIADAVAAYSVAHDPPKRRNTSALYGLAECYAKFKDKARFSAKVDEYLAGGKSSPNLASRLMMAAASLGLEEKIAPLAALHEGKDELDARYWLRRSTAAFRLGRTEEMADYVERSRALAGNDEVVLLELAELSYDPAKYWDMRYNSSTGERAPLPPSWRSDAAYAERTATEYAYLREVFTRAFGQGARFGRGADCGCGSGRMTGFLKEWVDELDCYDISETALAYAMQNTQQFGGLSFWQANLTEDRLPSDSYDLVFDFVVVQHQSDERKWRSAIANYVQSTKPGGIVLMVEQRGDDGPNKVPHVRNASAETYRRTLGEFGCDIMLDELTPWNEICLIGRRR